MILMSTCTRTHIVENYAFPKFYMSIRIRTLFNSSFHSIHIMTKNKTKQVASTKTIFQRIDIFDTINAQEKEISSYIKSQSNDGSYESLHPEYFLPEREIFLDGVLQSTRLGNEPYHEALVHPAMLAHPNPKRVGIIGGGEGATLREVLKHNTLEKVKMIEIDEAMVYFCKEHLPDWNSCADLEGSAEWCGDDARAEMYYEDGLAWFNNRFSEDGKIDSEEFREEPFDILIMDALDPQDNVPFADMLYTNKAFIKTLYNALSEDGIIIMQLGESPNFSDPAEELSRNSKRDFVMNVLEEVGFNHVHVYQEGHCKFRAPWSFAAAMKGKTGDASWQKTTAEIDVSIHKRILRTVSGEPAVKSFDGSLMAGFQIPAKSFETVYCRSIPTPENCGSAHGASLEEGRRLYDPLADRMGSSIGPKDLLASFQKKAY
jgi:spermidine synthase